MGINGTDVQHKVTPPLQVSTLQDEPLTTMCFAVLTD